MELKKTPKADLENKRGLFLEIGLCVTLLLLIFVFRMTQKPPEVMDMGGDREIVEQEQVEITFEQQKPPEVQQTVVQTVVELLNIVRDDRRIESNIQFADFDENAEFDFQPAVSTQEETVSDEPFYNVENMPKFQGQDGQTSFYNWVNGRVKSPPIASENGIQGRVVVTFVIERDGSLTNLQVMAQPDRSLGDEVVRVINTSPKWTPGSQNGVPVRVRYNLSINFQLGTN